MTTENHEGDPAPVNNFPQDPAEFDSDPRVSYSKLDDRFILETEDGEEFTYDTVLKRWIPTVCPSFPSNWVLPLRTSLNGSHWVRGN